MKERPIIFSSGMVRALLDGRKTQTRRIAHFTDKGHLKLKSPYAAPIKNGVVMWTPIGGGPELPMPPSKLQELCPYGSERLWVRENFHLTGTRRILSVKYAADGCQFSMKPSIHMPRWASRLTLEITGVKVEKLNSISEQDAMEEGFYQAVRENVPRTGQPIDWFRHLWDSINGKREGGRKTHNKANLRKREDYSWAANPWVWCISFKVVKP